MGNIGLRAWIAAGDAKRRFRGLLDDSGANEYIAVIILIVIVVAIGMALGPFRDAIVEEFNRISGDIQGIRNVR